VKAAVVTFPGSNGDYDLYKALQLVGCEPHFVWHRDRGGLKEYDAVLLPGGFSYGDCLRAGAIASLSPIMEDVIAFAKAGGPVLGICNGFQTMCEARLLPGALIRNESLRFEGRDIRVRAPGSSRASHRVWKPLQMPSTGPPAFANAITSSMIGLRLAIAPARR